MFGSNSTHSQIASCATLRLAESKSEFIKRSHAEVPKKYSDTVLGEFIAIGEDIVAWTLRDDNGNLCALKINIACTLSRWICIIDPQ